MFFSIKSFPLAQIKQAQHSISKPTFSNPPTPHLYIFIFVSWFLCWLWFHPRLVQLLYMADHPLEWACLIFFIVFIEFAWLYGIYNLSTIVMAVHYRLFHQKSSSSTVALTAATTPSVAILYTTCNDFVEESALSCVQQAYPNYTVYILDDSSDPEYKRRVDAFGVQYSGLVRVVRRPDRKSLQSRKYESRAGTCCSRGTLFCHC